MIDPLLLGRKLRFLRECLDTLREISDVPLEQYLSDRRVHGSVERFLHLAAEAVIDIGAHIVADERLGAPESYRDVFVLLRDSGKMEPQLAARMQAWAGFRDVLMHLYEGLDRERCWKTAREDLVDLDRFLSWAGQLLGDPS